MRVFRIAATIVFGALLVGLVADVSTASIVPVSGSTADPIAYGTSVDNVIDGVLDYDSYLALGYAGFGTFDGPYTVRFDLGAAYDLTGFNLWNNAGDIYDDGEGVKLFELHFLDSSMTGVGSYSSNALDILTKQTFAAAASGVEFVDFEVISSHSVGVGVERQYVDFYEVSFEGSPAAVVPEPTSLAIWALLGISGVGHSWRRRRVLRHKRSV